MFVSISLACAAKQSVKINACWATNFQVGLAINHPSLEPKLSENTEIDVDGEWLAAPCRLSSSNVCSIRFKLVERSNYFDWVISFLLRNSPTVVTQVMENIFVILSSDSFIRTPWRLYFQRHLVTYISL